MQWKQPVLIFSCQLSFMKQPLRNQQHSDLRHLQADRTVERDSLEIPSFICSYTGASQSCSDSQTGPACVLIEATTFSSSVTLQPLESRNWQQLCRRGSGTRLPRGPTGKTQQPGHPGASCRAAGAVLKPCSHWGVRQWGRGRWLSKLVSSLRRFLIFLAHVEKVSIKNKKKNLRFFSSRGIFLTLEVTNFIVVD